MLPGPRTAARTVPDDVVVRSHPEPSPSLIGPRWSLGGRVGKSVPVPSATSLARVLPWLARVAWVLVAVLGGRALESAVDGRSDAVRWTVAIGGWALWAVGAAALVIPSVRALTVIRLIAPLGLVATLAAGLAGAPASDLVVLAVPAVLATAAVFTADVGRSFVQASAYGDEARLPLRAPVAAGAAAGITWAVWAAALTTGPLLLAATVWVPGVALTALAVAGVVLVGPRWHRLSRRWLVLVPAGLVVHDPVVLADTLMLRTDQIALIRLAPADTAAADLTGPASGYALEIRVTETVSAVFAFTPREPDGRAIHMTAFLVSPSRPGEALREAAARRLPVA